MKVLFCLMFLAFNACNAARVYAADESVVSVPCVPLAILPGRANYRDMTHAEWQAARILFVFLPQTPALLPPGDRGIMQVRPDGTAVMIFVDGESAWAPVEMPEAAVHLMRQSADGFLTHVAKAPSN